MFELGPDVPVRPTADRARTLGEMFWLRCASSSGNAALHHKPLHHGPQGAWETITWHQFHDAASRVARGLLSLGLERGDRVAILGPTQPGWAIDDLGAQLAGLVSFGIYPKQSVEQVRYLLEHSEAKVIFVDEDDELETVLGAAKGLRTLQAIVPWTESSYRKAQGRDARLVSPARFAEAPLGEAEREEITRSISPDDTAILVYTSGTTGPPKGAMITHRNILSLLAGEVNSTPLSQRDLSLNFLPMAHAAERILGFYGRVNNGIPAAYAQSTATVLDDLRAVRPTPVSYTHLTLPTN